MIDLTYLSVLDAASETASYGVAFGPWGLAEGLEQSGVLVVDHVGLNVFDSGYDGYVVFFMGRVIGIGAGGHFFGPYDLLAAV